MKKKSCACKKKVVKHLKGDIKNFAKEAKEDRELIKDLKGSSKKDAKSKSKIGKEKMKKVMHEFKEKELHAGSKKGPIVKNPKQALAIAYSEAKRAKKSKKK